MALWVSVQYQKRGAHYSLAPLMDMWVEDTTRNEVHQIFSFLNIFQEMYVGWCNNGLHYSQMLNEGDTIKFNSHKNYGQAPLIYNLMPDGGQKGEKKKKNKSGSEPKYPLVFIMHQEYFIWYYNTIEQKAYFYT